MDSSNVLEVKDLKSASPREIADYIAQVLDSKKAKNISVVKVGDKTIIADYFVLACGNSGTHVNSLSGEVEYRLGLCGLDPVHTDGRESRNWTVLDYSSVIVHVFEREAREFYNLDKLYTDIG